MPSPIRAIRRNAAPQTVGDLVVVYLTACELRVANGELGKATAKNYDADLKNFGAMFGGQLLCDCRQYDLTTWLTKNPQWKSVNTKRRAIAAVLGCFRWAEDEQLIDKCPYRSPKALRGAIAETRRPATHDEYKALMEAGSKPLRFALLFLYLTGCRTSEMRGLKWSDVRLDDARAPHLYIVNHKTYRRTGRPRIVGLDYLAVRLLRALKRTAKSEFVFVNCDGMPWRKDSFCHHLRRTARKIGLDDGIATRVTAYCLRHTYACAGLEAGFTSSQVAHQLGHTSTKMVESVYARHLGQAVKFIGDVASGIGKRRT